MIFRKEMIQEIGLLDENYALICSDSDYCFTASSRGWEVWRIAGAKGTHEHGASGRVCDPDIELLKIKDMIHFGRKWLTGEMYKELSHEGGTLTPERIDYIMYELKQTRTNLERSFDHAAVACR